MDKVLLVPMTPQQKSIHTELADAVARLVAKWRRFHFLNETDRRILILCLSQMRMVADSTYILDQQTRFDTKIAELMYIFEEALADPEQKIVVFSQWERMTRLVAQELDARDTGYAHLHGGVPSAERAGLISRFMEDVQCRVFLSTDAGGVGLNLQSASLLINLDVPWNPAVLEQRIGRIHRMGQRENVRIINMVSAESIEQRMLGVLQFKNSMAQGVLDPDGDDTIFMSESKFKKFMENVESLTGEGWQAPPSEAAEPAPMYGADEDFEQTPEAPVSESAAEAAPDFEADRSDTVREEAGTAPSPGKPARQGGGGKTGSAGSTPATPQELIQTGMSFFAGLAQTLSSPEKTQELVQSITATDEDTGQTYLKIPVENAAVVENAVKLLGGLLAGLGR
jgi:superfamily II DNA/RNA helicase